MFTNLRNMKNIDLEGILTHEEYKFLQEKIHIKLIPAEEVLLSTNINVLYEGTSTNEVDKTASRNNDLYKKMIEMEKN